MDIQPKRFPLFNLSFGSQTKKESLNEVMLLAENIRASSVIFANAHVVVEAERQLSYREVLASATLLVPDGVPIAWLMHSKGAKAAERYSGPDLMADLLTSPHGLSKRHFFLGSTSKNLALIKEKFKGTACGFYSPPFEENEFSEDELLKQVNMIDASEADYIWVGLGAPKQERYVVKMASRSKKGVFLAVGAAFDFYAGVKPRAPVFLQKLGLEWAFRLASEPRRLTGRYLTTNPKFIRLALKELLS